jgi:hypothetical protein
MKKTVLLLIIFFATVCSLFIGVKYYTYVFAKTISGKVIRVERVNNSEAIIASKNTPDFLLFSFAVAIRDDKGEIHTASSEDRQWAVVSEGQCATVRFFPYPPWQLDKAGTYYGARLERLFDCKSEKK